MLENTNFITIKNIEKNKTFFEKFNLLKDNYCAECLVFNEVKQADDFL